MLNFLSFLGEMGTQEYAEMLAIHIIKVHPCDFSHTILVEVICCVLGGTVMHPTMNVRLDQASHSTVKSIDMRMLEIA